MIAISIGSNAEPLEARMNYINQAFEYLVNAFYPPLASSGLYESITAYVQNPSQLTVYDQLIKYESSFFGDTKYTACPSHLNAVFIFELVYESPEEVLDILQNIEERMGRDRKYSDIFDKFGICKPDNKPFQAIRPIDIDLLLYKGKNINTSRLTVPHSRMHERLFILYPLNDALSFNHLLQDKLNYPIHDVLKKLENNVKDRPIKVFPVQESKLWAFGSKTLPKIMGILNVTDNSFTDGGKYLSLDAALLKAEEMIHYGAQIIDVGGESSAPGNARVSTETELSRVIPVIKAIRQRWPDILISVDTTKSAVLREAVKAGANILNDISGGTDDEDMLYTAKELKCIVILGHRKGSSLTMNNLATYNNIVSEVCQYLSTRASEAQMIGIPKWRIILDVGIGFSKNGAHNLELIKNMQIVATNLLAGIPMCISISRKKFTRNYIIPDISKSNTEEESKLSDKIILDSDYISSMFAQSICHDQVKGNIDEFSKFSLLIIRTHNVRLNQMMINVLRSYFT